MSNDNIPVINQRFVISEGVKPTMPVNEVVPREALGKLKKTKLPEQSGMDKHDHTRLRQGRERHEGFQVGKYIQTPPMLFSRDGHGLYMGDMFRGRPCFLIAGGPSFGDVDQTKLDLPGVLTASLNNAIKSHRADIWISVDNPMNFIRSVWLDPKIMKLVPFCHTEKKIFNSDTWEEMDIKVGDCPNTFYYRRNEHFQHEQFLFEDTVNWGNHKSHGGGRSVMLAAIRLLFLLGVRDVFLLGVDFTMDEKCQYHFDQDRSKSSQRNNRSTYEKLVDRFTLLKPIFKEYDFNIYNCNLDSNLKIFPFVKFDDAIDYARQDMPEDITKERSNGLYDRQAKLKDIQKQIDKSKEALKKFEVSLDKVKSSKESGPAVDQAIKKLEDDSMKKQLEVKRKIDDQKQLKRYGEIRK